MEKLKEIINHWWTPAFVIFVLTTVFYGIVWGVQLNQATITQARTTAKLAARVIDVENRQYEDRILLARAIATQEGVLSLLKSMDTRLLQQEDKNHKHGTGP